MDDDVYDSDDSFNQSFYGPQDDYSDAKESEYYYGEINLAKLKSLREQLNWENEEERYPFYLRLSKLMRNWKGKLPNLKDIFRQEEMDWFLREAVIDNRNPVSNFRGKLFIEFVFCTGYRDEPELNEDGKPSFHRTTAVHSADTKNSEIVLIHLFQIYNRFDVNYTDESGFTHFHVACKAGCYEIVKEFLELGQDPNCLWTETGDSPLHLALYLKRGYHAGETMALLLRHGADPNWANKGGLTPLHAICKNCEDVRLMKRFFEITDENHQTILIDAKDNLGRTPLQLAVASVFPDQVDVLLDRGADLSSFVFPTESYFAERCELDRREPYFYLLLVSGALTVVKHLEKRGYELDRSDTLTIMKYFAKYEFFKKPVNRDECLRVNQIYLSKQIMFNSNLSFYELIQLPLEEVEKVITYKNLWSYNRYAFTSHTGCETQLCEMIARRFLRRWALEPLLELTRQYHLPILCCDIIIKKLTNQDLMNICFAVTDQSKDLRTKVKTRASLFY